MNQLSTAILVESRGNKAKASFGTGREQEGAMKLKWKWWSSSSLAQLMRALLLALSLSLCTATDHIVGANRGWNPGINYTLWANNQTFYVGDLISFRYQKNQYNVFEVNQTGYDNCTTEGALGNWSSGKDFIPLNKSQRYYFICGNGQCFNGMKVSILVHPLPSPPTSPESASNHSSQKSSSAPLLLFNWGLRTLLFSSAVAHFGLVGCI